MIENNEIKYNNSTYKKMVKLSQNAFPINFVKNNTIPVLCLYGGNDVLIGEEHYNYLKEKHKFLEINFFFTHNIIFN